MARVGNNLNQIARWANAHKEGVEAVEVIGHLIAIRRALSTLEPAEDPDADGTLSSWPTEPDRPARRPSTFSASLTPSGSRAKASEVLRGDPHQVAAVADALPFEHKYTSGVIAWAPEDQPTDEQIGAVVDAFEKSRLGAGWTSTATHGRRFCTGSAAEALTSTF